MPALGFGCWGLSGTYGPAAEDDARATIRRALELGITMLDTADGYGNGHNEQLVGSAIRDRRAQAFVATKFGRLHDADGKPSGLCGRPEYVVRACDASLRRLGIDVIDLYYYHRIDPEVPIAETVGAMAELVRAGKVRALGISEALPDAIRAAHAVHPLAAIQSEYSLFTRTIEDNGVLATARELGIRVVAYCPLGRGMLTAAVRSLDALAPGDLRRRAPRFAGENLAHNLGAADALAAVARELGASPAQIALAWLMARGDDVVPIPGTRTVAHLEENAAARALRLGPPELARIEEAVPKGTAAGARTSDPYTVA